MMLKLSPLTSGGGGAKVVPLPNVGDSVTTNSPSLIGAWQAGKVGNSSAARDVVSGVAMVEAPFNTKSISDLKFTELQMVDAGHTVTLTKRSTHADFPGGGCTSSSCRSSGEAA